MTLYYTSKGEKLLHYCKRTGLSYFTAITRIRDRGYSVDEAIAEPPQKQFNFHKVDGVLLKKLCRDNNINYESVLHRRTAKNETITEAYKHFYNKQRGELL